MDPETLDRWVRDLGHDADDIALVASAVAHWELLIV